MDYEEFKEKIRDAGRILIISTLNKDEKYIYELYKNRDDVEKHFDKTKNTLRSDIIYLQDDESLFGHMFVSFLSLYGYCTIQNMLRKSGLLDKLSPIDVLEEFSTVYIS